MGTLGLLLKGLGVLSIAASLFCVAIAIVFSDIRSLGAGGSSEITGDAVAIIAGLAGAGLLLWWSGQRLYRSARATDRMGER